MTDAYIQGFCKTAEAYGVDPEQLVKVAIGDRVRGDPILAKIHAMKRMPGLSPEDLAQVNGMHSEYLGGIINNKPHALNRSLAIARDNARAANVSPEMINELSRFRQEVSNRYWDRYHRMLEMSKGSLLKTMKKSRGPEREAIRKAWLRGSYLMSPVMGPVLGTNPEKAVTDFHRELARRAKKVGKPTRGATRGAARLVKRVLTRGKAG